MSVKVHYLSQGISETESGIDIFVRHGSLDEQAVLRSTKGERCE